MKAHDDILEEFDSLQLSDFIITSCASTKYNCVSWAVGDISRKWVSGAAVRGYYWPPGIGDDDTPDQWAEVFKLHGYEVIEPWDWSYEKGFEKIAIYADSDGAQHAARQLPDGNWSSKLGSLSDIEHSSLPVLEPRYGKVACILRRPHPDWN